MLNNLKNNEYLFQLSDTFVIDLANIHESDWINIKKSANIFVRTKKIEEIGLAYIVAFLEYAHNLAHMDTDSTKEVMN